MDIKRSHVPEQGALGVIADEITPSVINETELSLVSWHSHISSMRGISAEIQLLRKKKRETEI